MAGQGRTPKDPDERRGSGPKATVLPASPVEVPSLGGSHCPRTVRWWAAWCDSPMAQEFTETDWQRLLMVAELVDAYDENPKATTLAEIRLNESCLGATVLDRRRLGIKFAKPAPAAKSSESPYAHLKHPRYGHIKAVN